MTDSKKSAKKAILFTTNYLNDTTVVHGPEKGILHGEQSWLSLLHFDKKTTLTCYKLFSHEAWGNDWKTSSRSEAGS